MSVVFHPTPRRLLVRGVNWLGDAVMTTPALRRLREALPKAHIALLTPEKLADLWVQHPAVDEIIAFQKDESIFSVGKKLRAGKFELALVLPNSPRSALEVCFAGIPQRLGYARPWRNFFLTRAVAPRAAAVTMHKRTLAEIKNLTASALPSAVQTAYPKFAHQIFEYLHLAAAAGANSEPLAPQLVVTPAEMAAVKLKFNFGKAANGRAFFGVNPGAEYGPAKRWPVGKFIETMRKIREQSTGNWIIFGGRGDLALAQQIEKTFADGPSVFNLAGQTSLRELMAALKLCRVLLTNDTGPMHVAAALGTPVVVPFGSTSSALTGPGLPGDPQNQLIQSTAPCAPCFLRECPIDFRCMHDIEVGPVAAAVIAAAKL